MSSFTKLLKNNNFLNISHILQISAEQRKMVKILNAFYLLVYA